MLRELLVMNDRCWLLLEVLLRRGLDVRWGSLLLKVLLGNRFRNLVSLEIFFLIVVFTVIVQRQLVALFVNTLLVHFRYGLDVFDTTRSPLLLALPHLMMLRASL